jgi:formyl-CoA transferase
MINSNNKRALNGIRVLDVTQVMAGPFCTMLLCDMGADVIKIEPLTGDATRHWGEATSTDTAVFNAVNRGKRGIAVDLKSSSGTEIVRRLVSQSDILVENYRPGVMARFGLDYQSLRVQNRGLIYASISGYGQTGPAMEKGGFDLIAQGVSGIMSVTGEPGRMPVKAGVPLTDLGAGLFALSGILAALWHRAATGEGQQIDTSLVEAGLALSVWEATEYFATGLPPKPFGSAHRLSAPYQAIECADGHITIGTATDRLFRLLCQLLGHPEWVNDPAYASNVDRVKNHKTLAKRIETITTRHVTAHWLELFEANGIPCGPINSYADALADPHIVARDMVVETDHPTLGRIRTLGTPLKLSETPLTPGRPAPRLGQHTDAVLAEVGFDRDSIARLRQTATVG